MAYATDCSCLRHGYDSMLADDSSPRIELVKEKLRWNDCVIHKARVVHNHACVKSIARCCQDIWARYKLGGMVANQQSAQNDGEQQRQSCNAGYEPQSGLPPPAAHNSVTPLSSDHGSTKSELVSNTGKYILSVFWSLTTSGYCIAGRKWHGACMHCFGDFHWHIVI